jgi:Domain of Unknown Function (DUF748)
MTRRRRWVLGLAGAVVLVGTVTVAALPAFVKWVAIRNVRARYGRELAIDRIRLNLATGFFEIRGLRLADREPGPPLLEVEDLSVDLELRYLFLLRLVTREISLVAPTVRIVRLPTGSLNVSDFGGPGGGGGGGGGLGPLVVKLDHMQLSRGTVVFEDRGAAPPRTVAATDIALVVTNLTNQTNAAQGTARLTLSVAGAPITLAADQLGLAPGHAHAGLDVTGLDLAPLLAALAPAAAPSGGRLTAGLELAYDAASGARVSGDVSVAEARLGRAGQAEPLVSTPTLRLVARDARFGAGVLGAARLEVTADPTIVDGTRAPPHRLHVQGLRLVVEDVRHPAGPPAKVTLDAQLPGGTVLAARGAADTARPAATLDLTVASADLNLLRPYLPPDAYVSVARGRVDAALRLVATGEPSVTVDGEVVCRACVLSRRGQAEPFVIHPRLKATVTGLTWQPGSLALQRLALEGAPSVVDALVSPPVRLDFRRLTLVAEDLAWPSRGRARVEGAALLADGGRSTLRGTLDPETLDADVRVTFANLDVARAQSYVPAGSAVEPSGGRLDAKVTLQRARATGVRLDVAGGVSALDLALHAGPIGRLTDPRLQFAARGLVLKDGALGLSALSVTGAPVIERASPTTAPSLHVPSFGLSVRDVAWPARRAAPVRVDVALPGSGTLAVQGRAALDTRRLQADVQLRDAGLAALAWFVPITGPVGGTVDGTLAVSASTGPALEARVTGAVVGRGLVLGPADRPAVSVERMEASDIEVDWPKRARIGRLALERPALLVEREADGRFPLRTILGAPTPDGAPGVVAPASASGPSAGGATASAPAGEARPAGTPAPAAGTPEAKPDARAPEERAASGQRIAVEIGELTLNEGWLRFVDGSTTPPFNEEISRVVLRIDGLTTAEARPAALRLSGVIASTGALDLHGSVAPGADPFVADVEGEVRQIPVQDANPYVRRFFDWLFQRGSLTNRVHYRIVGREVTGENVVRLERLRVERDPAPLATERKISLPLGLIIAMVTDQRGDFEFPMTVKGELGKPGFSLGGAIASALRSALLNLVTGPFHAIGRIFGGGGEKEEFHVDPVTFVPGQVAMTPEGEEHLQEVAKFLHGAPNARLTLRAVVSNDELESLKRDELAAQIQKRQREASLATFDWAAALLLREQAPDTPVPKDPEEVLARLRAAQPVPEAAARDLVSRRLATVKAALEGQGIAGERLDIHPDQTVLGDPGPGRIEIDLGA